MRDSRGPIIAVGAYDPTKEALEWLPNGPDWEFRIHCIASTSLLT